MNARIVVIGVGNRFRRDDGFGPTLLDAIAGDLPAHVVVSESDGEPARLIDMWADADLAVVVEAVRRGAAPGSIVDVDARDGLDGIERGGQAMGSHSLGIAEAIALGLSMGRIPRRLRIVGVEPADLGYGEGLSDSVSRSLASATRRVLRHVRVATGC
jgi:hydrogenase maturation protease